MPLIRKPLPSNTFQNAIDCMPDCNCILCCIHDKCGVRIKPDEVCWVGGEIYYDGQPLSQLYPEGFHAHEQMIKKQK